MTETNPTDRTELEELIDRLLVRDSDVHREALDKLADRGDERVVPHLIEVLMIDSIGNNWGKFGFPEVLRDHTPPRYLELPEASWPGVLDALLSIAEPDFDSPHAWVEWESWYSQQDIDPLSGYDEWKLQLYRSYLPPVGRLLDTEPRQFDLQNIRWGNCDSSFLAALNYPDFVPGDSVTADANGGEYKRYLESDDRVFGFEIDGQAYAVPRWVIFPHELLNTELNGVPVSLTFCTLCNAPILYDRRIDGKTHTFQSSGMLIDGNKVMFDEETESLWSQHRGVPIAGDHLERDSKLSVRPVTQTDWESWRNEHPNTLAVDIETGYDYDYEFYKDGLGIFRHYWEKEEVVQPGVKAAQTKLPEKAEVYGVTGSDLDRVHIYPVDAVVNHGPLTDEVDGQDVIVLQDPTGDIAVYEAPPLPVEAKEDKLIDNEGRQWTVTRNALVADGTERDRVAGRHGLWFAFRSQYDDTVVVDPR